MNVLVPRGLLNRAHQLHFIGVGGAGMSGLAELCLRLGFKVSGCDLKSTRVTERLASLGVEVSHGHHHGHIADGLDAVVISSAVKYSNPEVAAARERKIPVIPRAEMLGELLRIARVGITIAGTHGKTTTTSLVAQVMEEAGFDPTVAIGGNLRSRGANVRLGNGEFMVAEADESDASFLLLVPTIAVVTNIDPEHLDHYGTMEKVHEAYLSYLNRVPFYGLSIVGIDSANVRALLPMLRKRVVTYGLAPDAELRAVNIEIEGFQTRFDAYWQEERLGTVTLALPGRHVALNALAAIAVAKGLGIDFSVAARALASFKGIYRRFEVKGEAAGRIVLDDYAHHPEEVRVTLEAARAAFGRRLLVVFQPHRFTRLRDLFDDFTNAFDQADRLYLMDVYSAGEEPIAGVSARRLYESLHARGHLDVRYLGDENDAVGRLEAESLPGDLVVTLGAGDVYLVGEALLARLGEGARCHEPA